MVKNKPKSEETMVHVGFRADPETVANIAVLEAIERRRGHRAPKSAAIRGGLRVAADLARQLDGRAK